MLFTSHDVDVIERALRVALREEQERSRAAEYLEVLDKLKESALFAMSRDNDVSIEAMH